MFVKYVVVWPMSWEIFSVRIDCELNLSDVEIELSLIKIAAGTFSVVYNVHLLKKSIAIQNINF